MNLPSASAAPLVTEEEEEDLDGVPMAPVATAPGAPLSRWERADFQEALAKRKRPTQADTPSNRPRR